MSTLIGAQSSFGLALRNTRLHLWLYSSWIVQAEIRACVIRCMLTVQLLNRSIGDLSPPAFTRDVNAQLSRQLRYNGDIRLASSGGSSEPCAHAAGVNAIAIDSLLSGGADSSVALWDLQSRGSGDDQIRPLGSLERTASSHKYGITQLSFYPFDPLAFLSSSYDHTLKVNSSETLSVSASFDLDLVIYSHSISSIAPHLLVACATQHSAVRLVDLKSGANTHSLVGHRGAVMTVAWSPTQEYILASGAADGTVLFWDIRMSSGSLEALDMENCIDITGSVGRGAGARDRRDGKAHSGAVNGLTWTDDGKYLATAGLDERIRVWDTRTAANTLVNFGPSVRNNRSSTVLPLIPPESVASPARSLLLFPSEREILVYELMDGRLVARLRAPGSLAQPKVGKSGRPPSNAKTRVNALQWKAHTLEVFSAHTDGQIRAWTPTVGVDDDVEGATAGAGDPAEESVEKKRRREALEDMYQDITQRKITFN